MRSFRTLDKSLKIKFNNLSLLETALTHRSYLNEHKEVRESNERLEFLGDAVLELSVSYFLFKKHPFMPEGQLTSLRSKIVQTKTLAQTAKRLGLPHYLKLSKGEKESGGLENQSILADTFEALIGAIFVDQGLEESNQFIHANLLKYLNEILKSEEVIDYKSQYQEIIQSQGFPTPIYKIIAEAGPDHDKTFTAAVFIEKKEKAQGIGKSKQLAEQETAKKALEKLTEKE